MTFGGVKGAAGGFIIVVYPNVLISRRSIKSIFVAILAQVLQRLQRSSGFSVNQHRTWVCIVLQDEVVAHRGGYKKNIKKIKNSAHTQTTHSLKPGRKLFEQILTTTSLVSRSPSNRNVPQAIRRGGGRGPVPRALL